MIHFVVPREQRFGLVEFLEHWGDAASRMFEIVHYEDLAQRSSVPAGTWVFSALDQLSANGTRLVRELEAQLRDADPRCSLLNATDTTLLRGDLLRALHEHGLNRHNAVRATADNAAIDALRYPVFLREEYQHSGSLSALISDWSELQGAVANAVVRGHRLEELLIVEFCDTAAPDGSYRKYAAFGIGSTVVPQFLSMGRGWSLNLGKTAHTPAMIAEEWEWVNTNPHEEQLRHIFSLAGTQYGRIDYALKDGRIETWEINLNPTVARYPSLSPELEALRRPTVELFRDRFLAAFRATDIADGPAGAKPRADAIPVRFSDEIHRHTTDFVRRRHASPYPDSLIRVLAPVRPLIDWMLRALSPIVVRIARVRTDRRD